MPFRIAARTLLELGGELISSDAVALYELVKNALDAGSPTVSVRVQTVVRNSSYQAALDALDEGTRTRSVFEELRRNVLDGVPGEALARFVDGLSATVGRPRAFRRALEAAYEAEHWIKVVDEGHGMSAEGLSDDFLTIGTRSRRRLKVSGQGRPLDTGRGILGDKGVGRLSAMRLGRRLSVVTAREGETHWNELDIDWDRFSHDSDALLEEVDLAPTRGRRKPDPSTAGTRITVSSLKGDWDLATFKILVREQFGRMVDPLPADPDAPEEGPARLPEDLLRLEFNGGEVLIDGLPGWVLGNAHAKVSARYDFTSTGSPLLTGSVDYALRNRRKTFRKIETELASLSDPIADRQVRSTPRTLRELGPFEVSFYWYNRRVLTEVTDGADVLSRSDFVREVRTWGGGLMVFRDGFRINPYGSGDDDWLELDKKALGARGYKVNRAQIIGRVSLTHRNHRLVEQTNREGLVDNECKQVLVGILRHVLITEFREFLTRVDEARRVRELTTTEQLEERIRTTRETAEREILELLRAVPEERERLQGLRVLVRELGKLMDQARQLSSELEDDKAKFTHLAGVGLMVEFILHEIGRATGRALDVVSRIDARRLQGPDADAMRTLEDQLRTLRKRVDNLDPLSTSRRQVEEDLDVGEVVRQVLAGRSAQFDRHAIEVSVVGDDAGWSVRAVRGMLVAILENLLENAVYWLAMEASVRRRFRPRLEVEVDGAAETVRVTDNGPGVDVARAEEIFEPFVTAKPPGEGRGLGLHISREMAKRHRWTVTMSDPGRVHPRRSNTFVISMGSDE